MSFVPSAKQQAIFDFVEKSPLSLIIEAVAGSGKTTTIVAAVKLLPKNIRIMFCAFNKSIATELSERLPDHVNCCTMNSLGHRAWMRHVDSRIELNKNKTYDLMDTPRITGMYDKQELRKVRYIVVKLVGFAKQIGMVPAGMQGVTGLVDDTDANWNAIIDHNSIDMGVSRDGKTRFEVKEETRNRTKMAIDVARAVLKLSIQQKTIIDFSDQLFLPVIYGANFPQNNVVFVDEAQDISAIQRVMLKRSLRSDGRLIAVGDPHQAIYGFRGADSESLNNIKRDFKCESLPLSISYRCAKDVVKEAQQYVEHIEAHEGAPDGKIEHLGVYNPANLDVFQKNDFVLCRNVAPLVKLAFALIAQGKAAGILGKDIGKRITGIINKLKANDIPDLRKKLQKWQQTEISLLQERDPEATGEYIIQQADAVRAFINCSGATTVKGVSETVEKLFSDTIEGAVRLSTIHKSKGLEAKRVIILDRGLMPSKYAVKPWQKVQENNLVYVAITRSIDYLGYIETPDEK